ncbi:MAG: ABC transporter ATP-binding protein [Propionibacteriales bacterium]|nr:ABC transporter ATP-binding protein [Propionibacteriales bacterium]
MVNCLKVSVEVSHLRVSRGGYDVIPDLSADIRAGEVTGLLGPSGCGKTTLMRSIVGVQRVAGGSVRVLGKPAGTAPLRRKVGYVTQAPSVYGDLTVDENLGFFAAVMGADASARAKALATVGLDQSGGHVVSRLSGGQRSRVSLAVALLCEPDVLVLDEPTVGLDPVLRKQLWATFAELAGDGATIIVSSHVMDEAERCDRLLLMREGALIADDSPSDLLAATHTGDVESAFLALVEAEANS